jgi:hypothetical protein
LSMCKKNFGVHESGRGKTECSDISYCVSWVVKNQV